MRTTSIYRAFLGLIVLVALVVGALYLFERKLTAGADSQLATPKQTPRAQAEFESGALYREYRQASEQELNSGPAPIDKVLGWMSEHPAEALK